MYDVLEHVLERSLQASSKTLFDLRVLFEAYFYKMFRIQVAYTKLPVHLHPNKGLLFCHGFD